MRIGWSRLELTPSAFVILAQSEFNLVGSPLYGVALKRHRRS